jgi:leucyl-tRNA synthetase
MEKILREYNFSALEKKWQDIIEEKQPFYTNLKSGKPKMFLLVEFPYPSGAGLHVGHPRSYVALDIVARKRRMEGFEVLYPMGFDAFGLPAENFAIKTGIHPRISTDQNITNFKSQMKSLALSFDWTKEVNTTEPHYYKWTQWMFLQMYKHGLAYKAPVNINWCLSCKTALANEEVVNGACERCGSAVERKLKEQWMMRITKYADRLADDLDSVDYITPVVEQQRNWIGRSEGADIKFKVKNSEQYLTVFTTRPDTIFGATYIVLAPEHPLIEELAHRITNLDDVKAYQAKTKLKSDLERTETKLDKSGIPLKGVLAINPANNQPIEIWIGDYVIMHHGTGMVMGVPAHDQRDWDFAKLHELLIVSVINTADVLKSAYTDCTSENRIINSEFLNGMAIEEAKSFMLNWLEKTGNGSRSISYKLHDWVFSRQRYWGEPIPIINCKNCGFVPIPEEQLPVILPSIENFYPTDEGLSPLYRVENWVKTQCPQCNNEAERETDTMPQWAGSCWYFLRYLDPHNDQTFVDPELLKKWLPVDWYNGGMEHTTLHLLYSRFWYKVLFDQGFVPTNEPYAKRTSHGIILGPDKEKMSKSRGNTINPDEIIKNFGADTMRMYEMFMGEFDKTAVWNDKGIVGVHRFLKRVYSLMERVDKAKNWTLQDEKLTTQMIYDVQERIERMKFNTAIASLMEFINEVEHYNNIPCKMFENFAIVLSLFAPHIAEEIWEELGHTDSLACQQAWPQINLALLASNKSTIAIQINGKLRDTIEIDNSLSEEKIVELVLEQPKVKERITKETLKKHIYITGKVINLVG